jgi:hypothetical protein
VSASTLLLLPKRAAADAPQRPRPRRHRATLLEPDGLDVQPEYGALVGGWPTALARRWEGGGR